MAIKLKVARTALELDDVFKLRYQVYVEERGKFGDAPLSDPRIVDHFDTLPDVVNIIAYAEDAAIATMRINQDSSIGLPAEHYFDFSGVRDALAQSYIPDNTGRSSQLPVIVSCSMLAIHKDWRNRRQVIFSLFKMAAGVMHSWGSTHMICSISEETLSLYGRLGFDTIAEPAWNESVGDSMVPVMAPFEKFFQWAFGGINLKISHFWLDNFCAQFERLLLSPGEMLFDQGDTAEHTYAVDEGLVAITRKDPEGNEVVLANLAKGALFGELAIFDGESRSAKATALVNTELISIERAHMFDIIKRNPENLVQLLQHLAKKVRETDILAMVQAFAPQTSRVDFTLSQLWDSAVPDPKNPDRRVVKIGPSQIARTARVREDEVRKVLEIKKAAGSIDYGENMTRFLKPPSSSSAPDIDCDSPV